MTKCLFCYQPTEIGEYHATCFKKFFGTTMMPNLELDKEKLAQLAQYTVNERLAITGVQPKLSLSLEGEKGNKRLTLVGLWGDYILKPQSADFAFMPEVEDVTMHLARLFNKYATNSGLDAIKYFRLVLFSFLTGNNDWLLV